MKKTIIPKAKATETAHFVRIDKKKKEKFDAAVIFSTYSKKQITEILFDAFSERGDNLIKLLTDKPF